MGKTTNTASLKKKITRRERQIIKYVNFSLTLIKEMGRLVKQEVESCHIKIEKQVDDFGDFRFNLLDGMTMFGGTEVTVSIEIDTDRYFEVMNIYWQYDKFSIDECRVNFFREETGQAWTGWTDKLDSIIKRKKQIMAALAREKKKRLAGAQAGDREKELAAKATRLGLA